MPSTVKTRYFSQFIMPSLCVACGNPLQTTTYYKEIRSKKSSWSGKYTTEVSVKFPLCDHCAQIDESNPWYLTVIGILAGLLPVGLCLYAALIGFNADKNLLTGVIMYVVTGLPLVLVFYLVRWASMNPEKRRLNRSVRVNNFYKGGILGNDWIRFNFSNDLFASQFSSLNAGEIKTK